MKIDNIEDLSGVEALIFDCDGTLVDSMPMWCENWIKTCEHFGMKLTEEEFYSHAGKTVEETFKILCKEQAVDVDPDAFYRKKDDLASEMIPLVREIKPVCDIARANHGRIPMAVVSSGPRKMVAKFLSQCKLETLFAVLICAEDVERHKPHPDPFLTAARSLGIPPDKCRVYEDADAGVEAALSAGMSVVDVRKIPGVLPVLK
ncbi:hypothetical protein GUITHDRAFT_110319 [Guillardia theta CCMP2712]|uniref:HAD family phosphatase n=2 Tax=Guillardia theta TaxID=55529 RepID=L1J6Y9_GUITC|nr:hypothetical protein GUITHDRAFT_110319 [Guillardia theta CCMP2712]EKX43869.1 hypothetical protein GUITHDRAFT_110319 [Guillardia theta CCMP2712]|eukprot:XP_005830849.1 hypothetical protein GUITHDRAFT_110319 [Guillardia theta CCMP2712]